jgi:hypothetical protein
MSNEIHNGMILTGENLRTRRKICPSATLFSTNSIFTDPGANLGIRGEKPATNRLDHGTAIIFFRRGMFHVVTLKLKIVFSV